MLKVVGNYEEYSKVKIVIKIKIKRERINWVWRNNFWIIFAWINLREILVRFL